MTEAWFYHNNNYTHCWPLETEEDDIDFTYNLADRGEGTWSQSPGLRIMLVKDGFIQSVYDASPVGWRSQHFS